MQRIPSHALLAGIVFTWFLPTSALFGQEIEDLKGTIETEYGRRYKNVEVLQRDPHGITFRHAGGIAKIPFSEFSERIQKNYQYDKGGAVQFLRDHAGVGEGPDTRRAEIIWMRRPAAIQFLPETYTGFVGSTPITYRGPTFIDALGRTEFHPPRWMYPSPANTPVEMYLWRQLSVQQHLNCVASYVHRPLRGYSDVRHSYRKGATSPRVVYEAVPAIGFGRATPATKGD